MARTITQADIDSMKQRRADLLKRIRDAKQIIRKRRDRRIIDLGLALAYGLWPKMNAEARKNAINAMMKGLPEHEAKRRMEAIEWLQAGMPD